MVDLGIAEKTFWGLDLFEFNAYRRAHRERVTRDLFAVQHPAACLASMYQRVHADDGATKSKPDDFIFLPWGKGKARKKWPTPAELHAKVLAIWG